MPNDAKLGLVLGVGLVIAIGVVYFRKEPAAPLPQETELSNAAGVTTTPDSSAAQQDQYRLTGGRQGSRDETSQPQEQRPASGVSDNEKASAKPPSGD